MASEVFGRLRVRINEVQIIEVPLYLSLAMNTTRYVQCMLPLNVTFLYFLLWLLGTRYGMCEFLLLFLLGATSSDIPFFPLQFLLKYMFCTISNY